MASEAAGALTKNASDHVSGHLRQEGVQSDCIGWTTGDREDRIMKEVMRSGLFG